MFKENGTLIALFALVFAILGLFWWLDYRGEADFTLNEAVSPTPSSVLPIDTAQIEEELLKNYQQSPAAINITVTDVITGYARGLVNFSSSPNWLWLAFYDQEAKEWQLLHDGRGLPSCQELSAHDFPNSLAGECVNEETGQLVTR